jgi:plasmid stabilization system protein ParE
VNYNVTLLPKARRELTEIWTWYEDKQVGLGERFEQEFFKKAEFIQNSPLQYAVKNNYKKNFYREVLLDGFPYIIVFRIIEKEQIIYIASVFHTSRHPKRKLK